MKKVSGHLHASAALSPGKEPWQVLNRRRGGPKSRSVRGEDSRFAEITSFNVILSYLILPYFHAVTKTVYSFLHPPVDHITLFAKTLYSLMARNKLVSSWS
jgi:hypothetical protein